MFAQLMRLRPIDSSYEQAGITTQHKHGYVQNTGFSRQKQQQGVPTELDMCIQQVDTYIQSDEAVLRTSEYTNYGPDKNLLDV